MFGKSTAIYVTNEPDLLKRPRSTTGHESNASTPRLVQLTVRFFSHPNELPLRGKLTVIAERVGSIVGIDHGNKVGSRVGAFDGYPVGL